MMDLLLYLLIGSLSVIAILIVLFTIVGVACFIHDLSRKYINNRS